ncbi:hypothetical protein ONZ45_g7571 [Pleurotus djamor]|nr:hypothetical protein ONZ45_g7571 [Pleurotus djamor]
MATEFLAQPQASSSLPRIPSFNGATSHDDGAALPLSDQNAWYYPSYGHSEIDDTEAQPGWTTGNWGKKATRGARWVRRRKIATWGPTMDDWETEDRARKRLKSLMPSTRRSPSPPTLPHLRSPSPPIVPPYVAPTVQHLSYTGFVLDKAVVHTFRSNLLDELEQSTNNLIENEGVMRRALGRLWQVIEEDSEPKPSPGSVVPKREDVDEHAEGQDDQAGRAPDLIPAAHKTFLGSFQPNNTPTPYQQSFFSSPESQLDSLEKSLAVLRDLQDDGREYVERLEEIREGLGDVRAERNVVWNMVRLRIRDTEATFRKPNGVNGAPHKTNGVDPRPREHSPPSSSNTAAEALDMRKLELYAQSIPYEIESYDAAMELLDTMLLRLTQCVEAKDYDVGLLQWESMIGYWTMLKYPIPKEKRIKLAKVFFHLSLTPGMPTQIVAVCADAFKTFTRSKRKLSIEDMRLPWRPIFDLLKEDLFLARRQFEYTQFSWCLGYIAENSRRFFHPAAIEEMLSTFVPLINGTNLDSVLSAQYYLLTFLPTTHPQSYLPMLFRLWEAINSYKYDNRMLQFLSALAELHVDPSISDPRRISQIPDDEKSDGEGRPNWAREEPSDNWGGIYKDVGIFTEHEWGLLMCKCLSSMELPLADGGSLTTGPSADGQVGFEIGRLPKPSWRISSLARIIVYSMAPDGFPSPASTAPTPFYTPSASGTSTPQIQTSTLSEFLSAPLGKKISSNKTYLAGSKALDSLARMIASTESFFHPSNSGAWTSDLCAFIKCIVFDFNKRWHEEQKPDCKTPRNRRLTPLMRRELVKCLRTVALLAIFSQDSDTVSNIQSCMKSMSVMEPDLILLPVLERAVPSLEALVETHRTMAIIKALGAVVPALVSRQVYYPGAKHLVNLLHLLIPGIDLNDPNKTLCTTAFLVEVSQYIYFGDLTSSDDSQLASDDALTSRVSSSPPMLNLTDMESLDSYEPQLSKEQEDALVKTSTGDFAEWITSFIRRIIQLLENLPEEGVDGTAGGVSEVQVVDAVTGACRQICVHLSEPLYDLVLKMVFDYASTTVRSNAVRAIHQLVECVANANPQKTLHKFFDFCYNNIIVELEHGASSLRTTSASTPMPSDATLHWNLAILRGTVYNDGRAVLKHQDKFLHLLKLLHNKTFSKRGYSWSGKLLSSMLLTLSHTYPLENRFVNPDTWESDEFRRNHHHHWGKLYSAEEVKFSWHVPTTEEIDFIIKIFKELIEPTLKTLEGLLSPGTMKDAVWRNDLCRHLSFVRNAFSGIPTFARDDIRAEDVRSMVSGSDILDEIPEMIGFVDPLNAGFSLTDPSDPRHRYITTLRRRFGWFLHNASLALLQQGEENTVDAVNMLVRSIRTYMLEYGDSRDSYYVNHEQHTNEANIARQYGGQKVWPRAVWVRKARYYNSARLRWNTIERLRGPLEDKLIDDVTDWCMWQYATIRQSSQSLLDALCSYYDGVRRRALPKLYKALQPGTDDDRMKGALWTLHLSSFGKYAVTEPRLCAELFQHLFGCQHNEKPSIQDAVAAVADGCIGSFTEPSFVVYDTRNPILDKAVQELKVLLPYDASAKSVVNRCTVQRIKRINIANDGIKRATSVILEVGESDDTHWKYAIAAVRCLRTLSRRDVPLNPKLLKYFLDSTADDQPNVRYYAQRAVMKTLRNLKLRTFSHGPVDLVLGRNHNPLKQIVSVNNPSQSYTLEVLAQYCRPLPDMPNRSFRDSDPPGWLSWPGRFFVYSSPHPSTSTFKPWDKPSEPAISVLRDAAMDPNFWENLITYYAEETDDVTLTQDNVSCVKSIFQVMEDEPLEVLKPQLTKLILDKDQNKQRAAAELLAGVLNGSKHWSLEKQKRLWKWFSPYIPKIFKQNILSDTLTIWVSFLEYMFYKKDPRRVQPLVDFLVSEVKSKDFGGESSFDAIKILSPFRAFYSELNWKFTPWADGIMNHYWREISNDHDDVRAYVGEMLAFSAKIKWLPKPSLPTVESFVKECRILPIDYDIMSMRGYYHKERIKELVRKFAEWRELRLPGARAFQSTYDRVGVTVCKWLWQSIHDTHAISVFDYILPLMPELFRFAEVNDNNELSSRASMLLVRMCGVTPPRPLINPILDAMFEAIQASPSWRVRLKALPLVQVFYFRQVPLITETKVVEILEVLCRCLDDEIVEVRQMAATTLSGILRLSPRRSVITLKDRFIRLAKNSYIPERQSPDYNKAIRQRHAAILGICALVDSYPYTVEKWMPELLANVLAEHTYDPIPISTTVRKCASNFKKTHQDTWHEDCKKFDEDQLIALSTLLTGSSYYA